MALRTLLSPWLVLTLFAVVSSCQQNESTCHSESAKLFGQPSENAPGYLKLSVHLVAIIVVELEFVPPDYSAGFVDWLFQPASIKIHRSGLELIHTAVPLSQKSRAPNNFVLLSSRLTELNTDLKPMPRIPWVPTESQFITHRDGWLMLLVTRSRGVYGASRPY